MGTKFKFKTKNICMILRFILRMYEYDVLQGRDQYEVLAIMVMNLEDP
jgi:hypothetical protein